MALRECPDCHGEVSDQANACPHCGYPISQLKSPPQEENETVSSPSTAEKSSSKHIYLAAIAIGIFAVIAIIFTMLNGKVTANNVGTNAVYHSGLGVGVRLGQSKEAIDKLLGAPEQEYGWYVYAGGLNVDYINGKVASLLVLYPNDEWSTKDGVTVGTSDSEITNIYGEPEIHDDPDDWYYYLNSSGGRVAVSSQINHGVLFKMNRGSVMDFHISNNFID